MDKRKSSNAACGAATVEEGREVSPKKLKIELSYNPAIPLLGIYIWKRGKLLGYPMYPNVHSRTVYNSQGTEAQPKCPPTDGWIKQVEDYSDIERNEILPLHQRRTWRILQ